MDNVIWIAWEKHRRTSELCKYLGVKLYAIITDKNGLYRYVYSSFRTIQLLINCKPKYLIVQNPSIILAFIACIIKPLFGYKLIIDRHSNFRLSKATHNILDKLFFAVSNYTVNVADLTIITNADLIEYLGPPKGNIFVLPDKLPEFDAKSIKNKVITKTVTFVCTYASDEPYREVIKAATLIDKTIKIYMTGNYSKIDPSIFEEAPNNLIITGYLPDEKYDELLYNSDIIMDFTTNQNCMVCGAYEAVAMGRPLITSDTKVLRDYFYKGTIHTDHSPKSISNALSTIYSDYDSYILAIEELKYETTTKWEKSISDMRDVIDAL